MSDPARRRLRWRCRRGMRELDGLLAAFVDADLERLSPDEISVLEGVLDLPDPELHAYLVGRLVPEDRRVAELIERIRRSLRAPTRAVD
jgi:antitoxin CptB